MYAGVYWKRQHRSLETVNLRILTWHFGTKEAITGGRGRGEGGSGSEGWAALFFDSGSDLFSQQACPLSHSVLHSWGSREWHFQAQVLRKHKLLKPLQGLLGSC